MVYDQVTSRDKIACKISSTETDSTITAKCVAAAGSTWFDGHFPGAPILPGVAQLAVVVDILKEALGREVTVSHISRVRFKSAVHPGDEMTVEIKPKAGAPLAYAFQISCGNDPVSAGVLTIAGQ